MNKNPGTPSARDRAVQIVSELVAGTVSPDGYSVNTTQPPYQPSGIPPEPEGDRDLADPKGNKARGEPIPPLTERTIGDALSDKKVSWVWYAGGWNDALADGRQPPEAKRQVIYNLTKG